MRQRGIFKYSFKGNAEKSLLIEAHENFSDRQLEKEEWEAFHARTYRQEALQDLRYSRLDSEEPRVDRLLREYDIELDKKDALYKQLCRISLQALAEGPSSGTMSATGPQHITSPSPSEPQP